MNRRIMMVGSAEKSGGGVAYVIRTMKGMPFWKERECCWLGTQIQRNYLWKLWYAIKAAVTAPFIMWRYGIVHFHTVPDRICLIVQMPELLCAKLYGKKVVMHIHMGNQLEAHTGNRLFRWCLGRADLVILLARRWEELFREKFRDIHVPTTVLYNACGKADSIQMGKKRKSIIMAVYLNDNKAPDLLLRAWRTLKDRFPDWRITVMGNGEVERFRRMAHAMGLDGCVSFTGYVTGREKERIWREASIYCMCSYNEGFPIVVLEAWAYGVAVITTPVGGLPDVIEEGRNCLTFPFGDAGKLAERLEELMTQSGKREYIAEYARAFVEERFSTERINGDITRIYNHLYGE